MTPSPPSIPIVGNNENMNVTTNIRYTSPENILYLWHSIATFSSSSTSSASTSTAGSSTGSGTATAGGKKFVSIAKVIKYLTNEAGYTNDQVEELIRTAINDKVVILNSTQNQNNRSLRIPDLKEIKINSNDHDWYCYECHKPMTLENFQGCNKCLRSFHSNCWRLDLNKPNNFSDSVVLSKRYVEKRSGRTSTTNITTTQEKTNQQQLNNQEIEQEQQLQQQQQDNAIEVEVANDLSSMNTAQTVPIAETIIKQNQLTVNGNEMQTVNEVKNECKNEDDDDDSGRVSCGVGFNDSNQSDIKLPDIDVICMGELRPPSRRRRDNRSPSCKPENNDDDEQSTQNQNAADRLLCTCCRTMEKSKLYDPPNTNKEEINYLLKFVFERIKSWISSDTFSPSQHSNTWSLPSKKHLNLFAKLCFKFQKSLADIDNKLKNKQYETLSEFQCDFMDLQHCIGILYGTEAYEYQTTTYLLLDCIYELSEIRLCRDCYRNSNEKKSNPHYWFCKPCVPRHELVYAKQIGYTFWPAKVVRVTDGNQYDVRFFGSNHSRAVVDSTNVRPIDCDIDELKIKKTPTFQKAMNELRKHQELLNLPPGQFSFQSEMSAAAATTTALNSSLVDFITANGMTTINNNRRPNSRNRQEEQINRQLRCGKVGMKRRATTTTATNKRRKRGGNDSIDKEMPTMFNNEMATNDNSLLDTTVTLATVKRTKARTPIIMLTPVKKGKRKSIITETMTSLTPSSVSTSFKSINNETEMMSPDDQESLVTSTSSIYQKNTAISCDNAIEKFRHELSTVKNLSATKRSTLEKLFKTELERCLQTKINQLNADHLKRLSLIKKRTWCIYCEKPAIYHCCWNTNYCSTDCQQKHWRNEHKKKCRRKS